MTIHPQLLGNLFIPLYKLYSLIILYIINVTIFPNVNTSLIHGNHHSKLPKRVKKQLKTQKQDEICPKIQGLDKSKTKLMNNGKGDQ